jgi:ATPase subunit of ABC transporter with duplicated ATPase domains
MGERTRLRDRADRIRQWSDKGARRTRRSSGGDKMARDWHINRTQRHARGARLVEKSLERLEPVEKPWRAWELRMNVADAPVSGEVALWLKQAVVRRGPFELGPVDLVIRRGERIAISGANGSGKTTLLDLLLGRIAPAAGERGAGPRLILGELDQRRSPFTTDRPLLDAFAEAAGVSAEAARTLLAKFSLGAAHVLRPARTLSLGERTRGELAVLAARGVNCLVLDEPTNHLDLPAIEQLEQALGSFDGTLILVTHDRAFREAVKIDRPLHLVRRNGRSELLEGEAPTP